MHWAIGYFKVRTSNITSNQLRCICASAMDYGASGRDFQSHLIHNFFIPVRAKASLKNLLPKILAILSPIVSVL